MAGVPMVVTYRVNPLTAAIARRLGGRRAALAAAALAASSPLLIWYSQEARAYALLVALCALSVWCLLRSDWRGWAVGRGRGEGRCVHLP